MPDFTNAVLLLESDGESYQRTRLVNKADWTHFTDEGAAEVPAAWVERARAQLPTIVRRDPRERYRATLTRITEDALRAYRATGRITWPQSAWAELKTLAWKTGDPTLAALGGLDQLQRQIEALTRQVVETGEAQQKEQDRRKVTLDWAGH